MRLKEKVAVVTGTGAGIGKSLDATNLDSKHGGYLNLILEKEWENGFCRQSIVPAPSG